MKYLLKLLVHFYRYVISPLLPNRCIYYPTCSTYALEALETHGAIKGTILAVKRVLSCNPLAKGGYDPVPEKGCWRNGVHQCDGHHSNHPESDDDEQPSQDEGKTGNQPTLANDASLSADNTENIASESNDPIKIKSSNGKN